jgi:Amt family ammonium transporter
MLKNKAVGFSDIDQQTEGAVWIRSRVGDINSVLFGQVSLSIMVCDTLDKVVQVNKAFSELFGYTQEEAIDEYCYDLIALPGERVTLKEISKQVRLNGVQNKHLNLSDKWGNTLAVEYTGRPILEEGKVIGTYRIYENKQKEDDIKKELVLQKAYFEGLFNTGTEAIVLLTNDDKVVYFNNVFEKLFGYSLHEAKGELINEIVTIDKLRNEAEIISGEALKSKPINTKTTRYHRDGTPIPVNLIINPISKDGELLGIYAIYKDLTEESRIQKELAIQSQYFDQLFESSPDAMSFLDIDQKIIDINKSFVDLFGYKLKECKGINIDTLIIPDDYQGETLEVEDRLLKAMPVTIETKRMKKDGEIIDVEVSGHPIKINSEVQGILVNYRDIRARKYMNEALEEQRAYFKQLFDNSPLGIAMIDTIDKAVDVNKGFCNIFKYSREEARGVFINDLIAPPELLTEADDLSEKLTIGEIVKFETKRRDKFDNLIDVDILAYPVWLNGKQVGGYAIYSDITEKNVLKRRLNP